MRSVPEWIGKSDDTPIPPRVKLRVIARSSGHCSDCGVRLGTGKPAQFDHKVALINAGENRETNLQALCLPCHCRKSGADIAQKYRTAKKQRKHYGIKKRPTFKGWRKFDGTIVRPR